MNYQPLTPQRILVPQLIATERVTATYFLNVLFASARFSQSYKSIVAIANDSTDRIKPICATS
jgi:hypothetical protein